MSSDEEEQERFIQDRYETGRRIDPTDRNRLMRNRYYLYHRINTSNPRWLDIVERDLQAEEDVVILYKAANSITRIYAIIRLIQNERMAAYESGRTAGKIFRESIMNEGDLAITEEQDIKEVLDTWMHQNTPTSTPPPPNMPPP